MTISNLNKDIKLEEKLNYFYQTVQNYFPNSNHPYLYNYIKLNNFKNILEVGSGLSGAVNHFTPKVYSAQDIISRNYLFYNNLGYKFYNCKISEINDSFDCIFSTFVFEHIVNPKDFLDNLFKILNKNGKLYIICPRYDFPFYIPPSLRHNNILLQIFFTVKAHFSNLYYYLKNNINFIINYDPACFKKTWKTDYDAIHLVSLLSIKTYCKLNNYNLKILIYKKNDHKFKFSFIQRIKFKYLQLHIEITK